MSVRHLQIFMLPVNIDRQHLKKNNLLKEILHFFENKYFLNIIFLPNFFFEFNLSAKIKSSVISFLQPWIKTFGGKEFLLNTKNTFSFISLSYKIYVYS